MSRVAELFSKDDPSCGRRYLKRNLELNVGVEAELGQPGTLKDRYIISWLCLYERYQADAYAVSRCCLEGLEHGWEF
jgi:hypothetical protein